MFSQNQSIQDGFNFPDTSKDLTISTRQQHFKFKRRSKDKHESYCEVEDKKNQELEKNKLYFKMKVIKRVGSFIQNLKAGIVLHSHDLKPAQLNYLQSQTKISQKENLIHHQNIGVLLLEFVVLLCLWGNLLTNSYQLIFSRIQSEVPCIQIISLIAYGFHIYFFLNSEFKNQKMELISNREVILSHYINDRLFGDAIILMTLIIKSTPLDQIQPIFIIMRLLALFMLKPINQISKKLQNIISVSNDMEIIISISGLFFKICLFLHSLSLTFTILSQVQKYHGTSMTWVEGNSLHLTTNFQQYVVGWYWGATVLSTVGFGDITPVNHVQRGFLSIVEVICCIVFGFFVNYIGTLINTVGQSKKIYQRDIRKLNRYLLKQSIPDSLKSNIRSHFFNKHKIQEVYDPKTEQAVIQKLTGHLTSQITETRNKRVVQLSKFISTFGEETVRKLSMVAKKMVFAPEQIIFSEKSKQLKLWILEDGQVEQIPTFYNSSKDQKVITVYDKDNERTLGWINFLTDKSYKTMARAKKFTLSYEIKQQDFFRILRENPSDYAKMCQLRQSLIENKRLFINKCLSCHRYTHNVIQCPRIHFKPRGMYKILIQQKKQQILKGRQPRIRNANRSRCKLNWKSMQNFTQFNVDIEGIIQKYNFKNEIDENVSRRCSVDSFANPLLRYKVSHQQKLSDKRESGGVSNRLSKLQKLPSTMELGLQLGTGQINTLVTPINNLIDMVYLKDETDYLSQFNCAKICKKYEQFMFKILKKRNRM